MSAKPLSHIRVLDLSRVLAGPLAAQILGDLGAEVIKIERAGSGDDARKMGPPFLKDRDGRDTREASVAEIAGTLGYVFQSPSHMLFAPTVLEELSFGPKNLKHAKEQIEKEVKEALKIVNLVDKEQDPPLALSFGQQKRVSIAAILAMRSRILVMDEPSAVLGEKDLEKLFVPSPLL